MSETTLTAPTTIVVGVAMMDQIEARAYLEMMRDDLHTIDSSIGNFRARALDFKEREGWRALGRFAWLLDNVRPLPEPIVARGLLGLWRWEGRLGL